jgi:hypothetical protein
MSPDRSITLCPFAEPRPHDLSADFGFETTSAAFTTGRRFVKVRLALLCQFVAIPITNSRLGLTASADAFGTGLAGANRFARELVGPFVELDTSVAAHVYQRRARSFDQPVPDPFDKGDVGLGFPSF